jgi:hypothetical protein
LEIRYSLFMIARLFLYCLGYLILMGMAATPLLMLYRPQLRLWWEKRQRQLQGEMNAKKCLLLEQAHCRFCLEPCSNVDCYEPGRGWFHTKCLDALLGKGE